MTIRPAASDWAALVRHNSSADAILMRRELGFATDRPIIMTGHQAEFWHPGILAKYLAADAAASTLHAQPAWLVVDQDRADSVMLRFPVRIDGALSVRTATVRERTSEPTSNALDSIKPQLESLLSTLQAQAPGPLPRRIASTLAALMQPLLSLPAPTTFATDLCRTALFRQLVDRMQKDPESCCQAYNAAARRHPTAGIRQLIADDIQDRWELPLWHLPPGKPRKHVYAEMLPGIPAHELAPKALFMTALMRLAACDLFIHGTGGGGDDGSHEGYDLITEDWLESWLGIARTSLAPMAVVSATRYLPLSHDPPPTADDVARARWLAHHARHDPALLNDSKAAASKSALLKAINAAHRHSHERADAFRDLHRLLDAVRRDHADALTSLDQQAAAMLRRFHERELIYDRTWPFALYPTESLQGLRDHIAAAFAT